MVCSLNSVFITVHRLSTFQVLTELFHNSSRTASFWHHWTGNPRASREVCESRAGKQTTGLSLEPLQTSREALEAAPMISCVQFLIDDEKLFLSELIAPIQVSDSQGKEVPSQVNLWWDHRDRISTAKYEVRCAIMKSGWLLVILPPVWGKRTQKHRCL